MSRIRQSADMMGAPPSDLSTADALQELQVANVYDPHQPWVRAALPWSLSACHFQQEGRDRGLSPTCGSATPSPGSRRFAGASFCQARRRGPQ